ncbi:MAG: polysaccharide biosynthesis tyrosine autokinase [Verrucomicrobia bacterium]|nr:polysaccharide biosynthesis tyrosine autokinase [Verrucomicrobiota bacterium]
MADSSSKPPSSSPSSNASRDDEDDVVERRSLRDYYIILRERLWIALPLALLTAAGFGYWKMREIPMYAAAATMQFEKPDSVLSTQSVVDTAIRNDMDMNTAIQQLTSGVLRRKVVESFTPEEQRILQRAALKRSPPGTPPSSVGLDLGNMTPVSMRNSYLISINVTHQDPEAAMLVANRYVRKFMDFLLDNASGKNTDAVKYLEEQAARLEQESGVAEQKLQQYIRDKDLISLDSSKDMINDALKKVSGNLISEGLRLREVENQYNQVEDFKAKNRNLLEISFIATHGSIPSLKSSLSALQQEQVLLTDRYLDRHPKMIDVANRIATTEDQLEKAKELAIADLKTRLAEVRQSVKTLQEEYAKQERKSMDLADLSIEYRNLKDKADIAKTNYRAVLDRLNQTHTTAKFDKIPLRPLDVATMPGDPYTPNKPIIMRTAIGLGVIVFFVVAVGLSFIDDRIKSAWDVESFIGANLLGIIPDLSNMKDEEKYTLLLENKQAPGVEAFLSVYSSIKIHSKLDFPKSILITSTIPGEGKTLISCNVAGSFARHGKRTLLIDCDLRRPMLHRHFKQQNVAGLIPWYEAGGSLEGDLATNPNLGIIKIGENLSLLCSGGRSKSPTEFLENPIFGQLLEKLKREYDLVIVDSPPLGAVTDSLLIAERIDEVVYVCRFNRAYRKHIRLYMRALRNGKNEVLGVVLNGLSPRRIEYYSNYRYYRSYKKYYGAQT